MGNLHDGHVQLILLAKKHVDIVIVSIFINPTQFNKTSDFKNYPKTYQKDLKILKKNKVDIIFYPSIKEMYPDGLKNNILIELPKLSNILEGFLRPGHFQGVAIIICKLFNIIQPNFCFLGEKDYQQLLIVKNIVKMLDYMISIISVPTVRSKNGLALSSRNQYLKKEEKKIAPYLHKTLKYIEKKICIKNENYTKYIIKKSKLKLIKKGFVVDLLDIYDAKTLEPISKKSKVIIILATVWLGKTRLIDNKKIISPM